MRVQAVVDEFHETSAQRWGLRAVSVLAALGAVLAAAGASGRLWPAGLVIVATLALVATVRADNHVALVIVVIVVWHWLVTVDDASTAWLPVAAVCLLVHHTVTALVASLPAGGELPREVVEAWVRRTVIVAAATVALWAVVAVLDGRAADGNGVLTALALAAAGALAVAIRSRSLDPPHPDRNPVNGVRRV